MFGGIKYVAYYSIEFSAWREMEWLHVVWKDDWITYSSLVLV